MLQVGILLSPAEKLLTNMLAVPTALHKLRHEPPPAAGCSPANALLRIVEQRVLVFR